MNQVVRHNPRIDWLSFSWNTSISFREMSEHIFFIKDLFSFDNFETIQRTNSLILEGEDTYVCFRSNLIYIQFHALYMYKHENYYDSIKALCSLINNRFNKIEDTPYFRSLTISRVDICQDFQNTTIEKFFNEYLQTSKYHFYHCTQIPYKKNNVIQTYYFNGSKYSCKAYRKDIEVKNETRAAKKQYFIDKFGLQSPVVRFETTIKESKNLKDETFMFYDSRFSLKTFCEHTLAHYYDEHRVRINKNTKQKSRWPECSFWKHLFYPNECYNYSRNICEILAEDLQFAQRKAIFTKALKQVVECTDKWAKETRDEKILAELCESRRTYHVEQLQKENRLKQTKRYFLKLIEVAEADSLLIRQPTGPAEGKAKVGERSEDENEKDDSILQEAA